MSDWIRRRLEEEAMLERMSDDYHRFREEAARLFMDEFRAVTTAKHEGDLARWADDGGRA